jgi:hypothetical protein
MSDPYPARPPEAAPEAGPADPDPDPGEAEGLRLRRTRARSGGPGRDALIVLGGMLLLGAVCGVLWWLLATPAEFTKTKDGGVMDELQLARRFSADATYVVIAVVAGLAAGLGLSWWRGRDPLLTSALLLLGSVLAAAAMLAVGHVLGPGDTEAALDAARAGARVPEALDVGLPDHRTWTVYLAWPVGVLAGALVVLLAAPVDEDS